MLLIPPLPLCGTNVEGDCTIDDVKGCAVFRAVFQPWDTSHSADGSPYNRQCMRLESVTGTTVFAYCVPGIVDIDGQHLELDVFREAGEPFAVIRSSEAGSFSVSSRSHDHWQVNLCKDFEQSHPLCARDENGALLAILEFQDEGRRWLIRIAHLCDAGLMITSVLGVLLLQQKAVTLSLLPSRDGISCLPLSEPQLPALSSM